MCQQNAGAKKTAAGFGFFFGLVLILSAPTAVHAGFFDIFRLPGEVEQLKDGYHQIQQHYDQVLQDYELTQSRLQEAKEAADRYEMTQQKLIEENSKLQKQNQDLVQLVRELQTSEQARKDRASQYRLLAFTAIGLAAGYFVFTRLMRVWLRSRT